MTAPTITITMTANTTTAVAIAAIVPPLKAEESPLCRGNGERQRQRDSSRCIERTCLSM